MYIQGKAYEVFALLAVLARQYPKMTVKEYSERMGK